MFIVDSHTTMVRMTNTQVLQVVEAVCFIRVQTDQHKTHLEHLDLVQEYLKWADLLVGQLVKLQHVALMQLTDLNLMVALLSVSETVVAESFTARNLVVAIFKTIIKKEIKRHRFDVFFIMGCMVQLVLCLELCLRTLHN